MYYTTMCWKIIEIKGPVNLVLIKNLETGRTKFCGKQEVSAALWDEHKAVVNKEREDYAFSKLMIDGRM